MWGISGSAFDEGKVDPFADPREDGAGRPRARMTGEDESFRGCGTAYSVAAIVDTPVDRIAIGSSLVLGWNRSVENNVSVFAAG